MTSAKGHQQTKGSRPVDFMLEGLLSWTPLPPFDRWCQLGPDEAILRPVI